ncbi:MAG: hypothetical protein ABIZ04_00760 [Opitutus sp.]
MKNVWANFRFWLFGVSTAVVGVFIARGVAPQLTGNARWVGVLGGQLLALAGLFVICLGVRQRLRRPQLSEIRDGE